MRTRVKLYVEGCVDLAKLDIKLHKFFKGYDNDKIYLEDASFHIQNAEIAIEYNMIPTELKVKKWLSGENK